MARHSLPRRTYQIASPWILVDWRYAHYGKAWPTYGVSHLLAADGGLLCGRTARSDARQRPAETGTEPTCADCRRRAGIAARP